MNIRRSLVVGSVVLGAIVVVLRGSGHLRPNASGSRDASAAERFGSLSREQVESLVLLGRVWGFTKYHHPRIVQGNVDWDADLRRIIPSVLKAPNVSSARDAIGAWLDSIGDPPACITTCASLPVALQLPPDVEWIKDEQLLGHALSARLRSIYFNRSNSSSQRYVSFTAGISNPDFSSDSAYAADSLPPADLRLLAVFRFWNILEYWFPYRNLMEQDRVAILREFVPAAWSATDVSRYTMTMARLVARARDTHANLRSAVRYLPPVGDARVPVTLRFIERRFVVTGFSSPTHDHEAGLEPGDVILAVDTVSVDTLARARTPYFGASNDAARFRSIARTLLKGPAGQVRLEIKRGDRLITLSARRVASSQLDPTSGMTHDLPGETFQIFSDGHDSVAYLKLSSITADRIPEYMRRAANTKVLAIDIRNYPKEFVVFELGGHLTPDSRPFVRFATASPMNPGAFAFTPPLSLLPSTQQFTGRVVILVDESTLSQAEYTAMALRSVPKAMIVGSMTAGADGNVSLISLPGGLQVGISGIGVFYPDGRPTQQVGIVPDVEVRPTIAGIRAGRDEVLEAAVSRVLGRPFSLRQ